MTQIRSKPSSKAREVSYGYINRLFWFLDLLKILAPSNIEHPISHKDLKDYVIRYTPPDKRGGPSTH